MLLNTIHYGQGKHCKDEMQRMQEYYSFYNEKQEEAERKTWAEKILQILSKKHLAQGSEIDKLCYAIAGLPAEA